MIFFSYLGYPYPLFIQNKNMQKFAVQNNVAFEVEIALNFF